MKLLFDTHTLIWWHSEPTKLPSKILALCQDLQPIRKPEVQRLRRQRLKAVWLPFAAGSRLKPTQTRREMIPDPVSQVWFTDG